MQGFADEVEKQKEQQENISTLVPNRGQINLLRGSKSQTPPLTVELIKLHPKYKT